MKDAMKDLKDNYSGRMDKSEAEMLLSNKRIKVLEDASFFFKGA